MVKTDLDPLLRRFDTGGNGRVSLASLMRWADRNFSSSVAVENAVRKIVPTVKVDFCDGTSSGSETGARRPFTGRVECRCTVWMDCGCAGK